MPVDADGNRADMVMDPNATMSRMNPGRLYEQYINAASRDVSKRLRTELQLAENTPGLFTRLLNMETEQPALINTAWDYLMGYYRIVSPKMYLWFTGGRYVQFQGSKAFHLACIIKDGIYLYMPPDNDPEPVEMIRELEKHYRPTYGPVTYKGYSGNVVTTIDPVRIGSVYIILLEKIGDDWTAVSSAKLQHHGVLAQVSQADKYSQPTRVQPIRAFGEAEVRITEAYAGPEITADILDRNNNPAAHRAVVHSILEAERPTNIYCAINRAQVPLGGSKPLQLAKHIGECAGWRFHFEPREKYYA